MSHQTVSEIGHNFNSDLFKAIDLIHASKDCGCDYVKFQLYDTDKIKSPGDTNYSELKKAQLSYNDMWFLYETAKKAEIGFICSVFDVERLNWYMETDPIVHKIASRSIFDEELIREMKLTQVPIIASLGAWDKPDFPKLKADFLFCLSRRDILQNGVTNFPEKFDKYAGFSDHTIGIEWAKKAIDRGARIIEKHFTIDHNLRGWDQCASATYKEMKEIVDYGK